jgi:hypothetical protein
MERLAESGRRGETQCGCDLVLYAVGFLEKPGCTIRFDANAVGSGRVMAKVIEFYIPDRFRKRGPWTPPAQRGKVIEFPSTQKKSA